MNIIEWFKIKNILIKARRMFRKAKTEKVESIPVEKQPVNDDFKKVAMMCDDMLNINPDYCDALLLKADAFIWMEQGSYALDIVNRVLKEDANNGNALLLLANVCWAREEYSRAEEYLKRIIKREKPGRVAWIGAVDYMVGIKFAQGKRKECIPYLNIILSDSAKTYFNKEYRKFAQEQKDDILEKVK
ncbi:MAG: tetratricopeptide repeat protein [bacterium]|nr:tetratricopeptide repeat protein [bacterium]